MKKESIKVDKAILEKAKELKQKTDVPIGSQFERGWTGMYVRGDKILISSKLLQAFLSKITAVHTRYDGEIIAIKCENRALSFGSYLKASYVDSNDWQTEKTNGDLKRLYKFLLTFSEQPLSVSFTAHSVFIEVNGILI